MLRPRRDDRARRDAVREQKEQWRRADPSCAPAPAYMGKDVDIVDSALSPDGRWLIAVTQAKDADGGQAGQMPRYVTDRKSVVSGKSVSVRVDLGGRRII